MLLLVLTLTLCRGGGHLVVGIAYTISVLIWHPPNTIM